jgi:DNA-binding NarL/FixJ family response regulator
MTIADLQSMSRFEGWMMMPRSGPRLPLTPRERQILDLVLGGRTTKEVAFDLGLSNATVRVLYARAMKKLGRVRDAQKTDPG